jgi:hypothetical protein
METPRRWQIFLRLSVSFSVQCFPLTGLVLNAAQQLASEIFGRNHMGQVARTGVVICLAEEFPVCRHDC